MDNETAIQVAALLNEKSSLISGQATLLDDDGAFSVCASYPIMMHRNIQICTLDSDRIKAFAESLISERLAEIDTELANL